MIQQRKNEEAQIVATLRPRIAGVHMKEDSLPVLDASLSFPDAPDCFRPQELHVTKIQIPIAMRRLSSHSNLHVALMLRCQFLMSPIPYNNDKTLDLTRQCSVHGPGVKVCN